jgi:hypothetical protein
MKLTTVLNDIMAPYLLLEETDFKEVVAKITSDGGLCEVTGSRLTCGVSG